MKVLLVTLDFGDGGAEKLIVNLANNFVRTGNEVMIVSLWKITEADYFTELLDNNVKIISLDKSRGLDLSMFYALLNVIRSFRPEIVHTHRSAVNYLIPLLLLMPIVHVHTIHNEILKECRHTLVRKLRRLYLRIKRKAVFVALTKDQLQDAHCVYGKRVELIYNGVEDLGDKGMSAPGKEAIIVARISRQKNHQRLFEALEEVYDSIPDFKLNVVGRNELRLDLNRWPFVNYIGTTNNVAKYLRSSSVFLLSSDFEGLPLAILEGMSVGLPVISTPVDSLVELKICGIDSIEVCDEFSVKSMVKAFRESLELSLELNSSERLRIRQEVIQKFGIERCANNYLNQYDKLLQ